MAEQRSTPLPSSAGAAYTIRAGRLIIRQTGSAKTDQFVSVTDGRIVEVGSSAPSLGGAEMIDLSDFSVLPGLVDAHDHLAITYKKFPENNVYYYTYVQDSTAIRAIQAVSNGLQILSSGFTVERDCGNCGLYADTALRVAIEQGWIPGPIDHQFRVLSGGWAESNPGHQQTGEAAWHRVS